MGNLWVYNTLSPEKYNVSIRHWNKHFFRGPVQVEHVVIVSLVSAAGSIRAKKPRGATPDLMFVLPVTTAE